MSYMDHLKNGLLREWGGGEGTIGRWYSRGRGPLESKLGEDRGGEQQSYKPTELEEFGQQK